MGALGGLGLKISLSDPGRMGRAWAPLRAFINILLLLLYYHYYIDWKYFIKGSALHAVGQRPRRISV